MTARTTTTYLCLLVYAACSGYTFLVKPLPNNTNVGDTARPYSLLHAVYKMSYFILCVIRVGCLVCFRQADERCDTFYNKN